MSGLSDVLLLLRRLTTTNRTSVTPQEAEPVYDTTTKRLYIGDGATAGGIPVTFEYKSSDGTPGATDDVAVAKSGGGMRTIHFKDGQFTGYTDSST